MDARSQRFALLDQDPVFSPNSGVLMLRLDVLALLCLCSTACIPAADGPDGNVSSQGAQLVNVRDQTLSDECTNGGVDIEVGIDENADELLGPDEVDTVVTVCNGENGSQGAEGPDSTTSLIKTRTESQGSNCPNGGIAIETGIDANKNGILDDQEVEPASTTFVCNGEGGSQTACGVIEGTVTIESALDLRALTGCTAITGNLIVRANGLNSLAPLSSLTAVGGDLIVQGNSFTTLAGLEGLTSVGGQLVIEFNPSLTALTALEDLTSVGGPIFIGSNASLSTLAGLEGLTIIDSLEIAENDGLTTVAGLERLTSVGGDLTIISSPSLTTLAGFATLTSVGRFIIDGATSLTTLTGLEGLTNVDDVISIQGTSLVSLNGLENLTNVRLILVDSNSSLPSCEVEALSSSLPGTLQIDENNNNTGTGTCDCGDTIRNFGEGCDDGNNDGGDGCSAVCLVEQ